jgi:hypothetical protein
MRLILFFTVLSMSSDSLAFTFENLKEIIEKNNARKIEDLLPLLPQEAYQATMLAHKSRSLQPASALEPRAILSFSNSTLFLAFDSGTKARPDRLEVIQYREQSKTFEFREINFPTEGSGLNKVRFSEANPTVCMGCHRGPNPRPNWDSYKLWPGFYGSGDKEILRVEQRDFENFRATFRLHPRYKYLKNIATVEQLENANTQLSIQLGTLNFNRMLSILTNMAFHENYKYAMTAAFRQCQNLTSYLPPKLASFHENKTKPFYLLKQDTLNGILKDRTPEQASFDIYDDRLTITTAIRFLLEPLQESVSDFSMSFDDGTYRFSTGSSGILEFAALYNKKVPLGFDCVQLKTQSLEALEPVANEVLRRYGGDL